MSEHEEVHTFILINTFKEQSDKEKAFQRKEKGFEATFIWGKVEGSEKLSSGEKKNQVALNNQVLKLIELCGMKGLN